MSKILERNWDFIQPEDYKLIPLTKGAFAKVDNDDFERLKGINWNLTLKGYAINHVHGRMHRMIINAPANLEVDHINNDRLDNRKANLRVATRFQNNANNSPKKNTSSKYKGVIKSRTPHKWFASIFINKKLKQIGTYLSEEEAAKAYDRAAYEHYGEFAYLNFPDIIKKQVS